jgi:predicted nucleic acid-binding protein
MPGKVADASVVAALVFRESRRAEAAELLGDDEVFAPTLLAYELTNVAVRKRVLFPDELDSIVEGLELGLGLVTHWVEVDHPSVFRVATDSGLTAYDAAYLWVSLSRGIPLITFDRKLRAASP